MLKLASYDIVFQEIPDEITLALNLSNCPIRCKGCHSPHLMDDIGELLDMELLDGLIEEYKDEITCVCFMGGDASVIDVQALASYVQYAYSGNLKVGWYSGRKSIPNGIIIDDFNYIKIGPYIEEFGGLKSKNTNQKMYKINDGVIEDITYRFQQKGINL